VDTLLDTGSYRKQTRDGHNKVYKSLSDVIEGKEWRFRETLHGKQVDYSGVQGHCCGSFTFITSMWITARDSNNFF
jgi:hypothetical protein